MEIRKKITYQFTAIVAILLILSLTIIYLMFSSFRQDDFKERLENKARSVAQLVAETEITENGLIKRIEKNNPTSLPKENILIFDENNQIIYFSGNTENNKYSDSIIEKIRKEKTVYFKEQLNEIYGYYYEGLKAKVVVICSAVDVFGLRKLRSLSIILMIVFIFSMIMVYYLGRFFSTNALKPISGVVNQINNIDISNISDRVKTGNEKDEIAILAETFNKMLERIEKAFKIQKDFIANASHELRTPLTVITGQLDVCLLQKRTGDEYAITINTALDEIKKLNNLVNRLLILLRAGSEITNEGFEALRIDDILWISRSEILKRNENYIVNISFDETIKDEHHFNFFGSPELLKTAFINVIENSCKYSTNYRSNIFLSFYNDLLTIKFKDNGIGIPENEIEFVFEPFYRAANTVKKEGYGIGLSLVKKIVTIHKGELKISSYLGKGTEVIITLPVHKDF